jgi:hypothetical protein
MGWLAIVAVSTASLAWTGWNLVSLMTKRSVFVLTGRFGQEPNHWTRLEVEPIWVVLWAAIDLLWFGVAASLLVAAVSWIATRTRAHQG